MTAATKLGQLFSLLSSYEEIDAALGPLQSTQATCASVSDFVRQAFLKDPTSDYMAVVGDAGKDLLAGNLRRVEVVCTFHDYAFAPASAAKKLSALEQFLEAHSVNDIQRTARSVQFLSRKGVQVEVFPAPAEVDWYNIRPPQIPYAAPAARLYQTLWLQRQEPGCKAMVRFCRHWADAVWGAQQRFKPSSELLEHLMVYTWSTLSPRQRQRPRQAFQAFLAVGSNVAEHIVLQDYFAEPLVPVVGYQRVIMNVANPRDNLAGHINNWVNTWPQVVEFTNAYLRKASELPPKPNTTWLPSPRTEHVIFVSPKTQLEKALSLINAAFDNGALVVEVDGVGAAASDKTSKLAEQLDRATFQQTKVETCTADGSAPVLALLLRRKPKQPEPKAAAAEGAAEQKPKKSRRKPKDATPAAPVAEGDAAESKEPAAGAEGAADTHEKAAEKGEQTAPADAHGAESNGTDAARPRHRARKPTPEGREAAGDAPEGRPFRRRERRRDQQPRGVWVKAESKTA